MKRIEALAMLIVQSRRLPTTLKTLEAAELGSEGALRSTSAATSLSGGPGLFIEDIEISGATFSVLWSPQTFVAGEARWSIAEGLQKEKGSVDAELIERFEKKIDSELRARIRFVESFFPIVNTARSMQEGDYDEAVISSWFDLLAISPLLGRIRFVGRGMRGAAATRSAVSGAANAGRRAAAAESSVARSVAGESATGGVGEASRTVSPASVKNFRGEPVRIPEGHIMSPRDPAMSAPPIVERGPFTTAQRDAMLQGGSGGTRLSPHHRHQIPTTHGGVIDELPGPGHPAGNVHTAGSPSRHPSPSVFNSIEGGKALRSSEIRAHWQSKAQRMVEVEPGVWIDPGL